ncbi:MAG: translation initiation factor IF-3 [Candidatus Gracilibacteria bacterium]|nr:translation initiation factor IF-3 [Candidatus Gracilibacteria bacterium]
MKRLRKNNEIRTLAVRVIGPDMEQLGLMPIEKAKALAKERGTDLVEVSPKAQPPVCKLMDYGKYLYKIKKQDQAQKKKVKKTEVKGVRLGLSTGEHDLEVKRKAAIKFLCQKHLVKVAMIFKGREMAHKSLGKERMISFAESLSDFAIVENTPKDGGYQIVMILSPAKDIDTKIKEMKKKKELAMAAKEAGENPEETEIIKESKDEEVVEETEKI